MQCWLKALGVMTLPNTSSLQALSINALPTPVQPLDTMSVANESENKGEKSENKNHDSTKSNT